MKIDSKRCGALAQGGPSYKPSMLCSHPSARNLNISIIEVQESFARLDASIEIAGQRDNTNHVGLVSRKVGC
jgi:hypothetical protein